MRYINVVPIKALPKYIRFPMFVSNNWAAFSPIWTVRSKRQGRSVPGTPAPPGVSKNQDTDVVPWPDQKVRLIGEGESDEPPFLGDTADSAQPKTPHRPTQELIDEGRRLKKERLKRAKVQKRAEEALKQKEEVPPPCGWRTPDGPDLFDMFQSFLRDEYPDEADPHYQDEDQRLEKKPKKKRKAKPKSSSGHSHSLGSDVGLSTAEQKAFEDFPDSPAVALFRSTLGSGV